jgi:proteic killer suppression protein
MIKSFRCKETQGIYEQRVSRKLPRQIQQRALGKLQQLDAAGDLRDLMVPPSNHLEALKGERLGQWSIRINQQWRICFKWNGGNAYEVEIVDYH